MDPHISPSTTSGNALCKLESVVPTHCAFLFFPSIITVDIKLHNGINLFVKCSQASQTSATSDPVKHSFAGPDSWIPFLASIALRLSCSNKFALAKALQTSGGAGRDDTHLRIQCLRLGVDVFQLPVGYFLKSWAC